MSDAAAVERPLATGPSAGSLLRQAREAAGLHVAALAVSLKVPVRKLEALEEDRYQDLPDAVFARALASSVCRSLKIDPQPVLQRLPQTTAPRLVPEHEALNAPFRAPGDVTVPAWREQAKRPVTLAVGALLLGAAAIVFLPNLRIDDPPPVPKAEAPAVPMAANVVVQPAAAAANEAAPAGGAPAITAAAPTVQAANAEAAPAASLVAEAAPAAVRGEPAAAATTAASVPAAAAPAAVASATDAAPSAGVVVFKTSAPSWVQVTDARGNVSLRRLMTAGETAAVAGSLPLTVTVGDVKATTVSVRGKPFDLGPVSRDNVARFEVK